MIAANPMVGRPVLKRDCARCGAKRCAQGSPPLCDTCDAASNVVGRSRHVLGVSQQRNRLAALMSAQVDHERRQDDPDVDRRYGVALREQAAASYVARLPRKPPRPRPDARFLGKV